jgi:integrase
MAIKEMAGHSSIRTTFDVYGHLFPHLAEATAQELDKIARAAKPLRPARVVKLSRG